MLTIKKSLLAASIIAISLSTASITAVNAASHEKAADVVKVISDTGSSVDTVLSVLEIT